MKVQETRRFKWTAGMLTQPDKHGRVYRVVTPDRMAMVGGPKMRCPDTPKDQLSPDVSDAATIGALIALVDRPKRQACVTAFDGDLSALIAALDK